MKMSKEKKMKKTFCLDCADNPMICGKKSEDCMKEKEARLYFCKYDEHWPIQIRKGMWRDGDRRKTI